MQAMSKKEQTKTLARVLKSVMIALLLALFGILALVIMHYKTFDSIQAMSVSVSLIVTSGLLLFVVRILIREIHKIGEM